MPDLDLLMQKIDSSGMTMVAIAGKTGILRETLYNKLRGASEFKASEITNLSKVLGLSTHERDAIFFGEESELHSTINCNRRTKEKKVV